MKKMLLGLVALSALWTGCKKDQTQDFDYFIFGRAFGECMGDCAEFYKIENGQIYADNDSNYYDNVMVFQSTPGSSTNYQLAEPLTTSMPSYFNNHVNETFGCPDCVDQGIIEIRISENGVEKFWKIDAGVAGNPAAVQSYVQQMIDILNQL